MGCFIVINHIKFIIISNIHQLLLVIKNLAYNNQYVSFQNFPYSYEEKLISYCFIFGAK